MTEQEAIEGLKLEGGIEITGNPGRIAKFFEALDMAISAFKEIQQYKDNRLCLIPEDVYSRQCSELDAYKEIGTVEECRETAEKQRAKRPTIHRERFSTNTYNCPTCGNRLINRDVAGWYGGNRYKFCNECGQAIQWDEDLEEKI
nr:hypothetical protein [uncultured Sellimonas sp.]